MKPNQLLLLPALILLLGLSRTTAIAQNLPPLTAQEKADLQQSRNYGFLAKEEKHIRGAWDTYQQLKNSGITVRNFEVVAIGGVVKLITAEQELGRFIQEKSDGVFKVTVCKVAMNRLKVEEKDLPKAASVTSNAYIRLYQLQAKQYLVIQP